MTSIDQIRPLRFSDPGAGPPPSSPSPGTIAAAGKARRRIAIVEDELMVAWALESVLEDAGHTVVGIYPNAEAALAGLLREPAELVLMDINLGGGTDGVETARRIRTTWNTPIIFISAYADAATRQRIQFAVPGAPLLSKPLQAIDLDMALMAVFTGSH